MKRIFLLLTVVAMTALTGCSSDDDRVDNDTVGLVFDITRNFSADGTIEFPFNSGEVFSGDGVLIYWMEGTTSNGNPIWRLIPQDLYFPNAEYPTLNGYLTYNYDFTTTEAIIYADTDQPLAAIPNYTVGQIFRIIIVPGQNPIQARTANTTPSVDTKDYQAVIKAYGINDSNVQMR